MKLNHQNFTIEELQTNLPPDVFLRFDYEIKGKILPTYQIPESFKIDIDHGSENLYFTIDIYKVEGYTEYKLTIWSKDNRQELMKFITELLTELVN